MSNRRNNEKLMRIAHELNKVTRFLNRAAAEGHREWDHKSKSDWADQKMRKQGPLFTSLEGKDLQKMASKISSAQDMIERLDREIEDQVGHMMKQRSELKSDLKKLYSEAEKQLPLIEDSLIETKDKVVRLEVKMRNSSSRKRAMEDFPERVRDEMGDVIADRIEEILQDSHEFHSYVAKNLKKLEVVDKKSHVYREAGAIELMTKAVDWVKRMVKDAVKFLKTAAKRITRNADEANDVMDELLKSMEG